MPRLFNQIYTEYQRMLAAAQRAQQQLWAAPRRIADATAPDSARSVSAVALEDTVTHRL